MQMFKLNKSLHKWLSLVVGIQLIIWLGTGLYFNLMDHKKASGNALRVHAHHENKLSDFTLIPIAELDATAALEVELLWAFNRPYYQLVFERGQHSYQKSRSTLIDAVSGEVKTFQQQEIAQLALSSYSGDGKVSNVALTNPPFSDYVQQQNPMWKVTLEDDLNTVIYLDGITGKVIRHANDDYRLKDLMLMLHFMDYGKSGGFNHWLIIAFAVATLLLSLTGITWLIQLYKNGMLKVAIANKKQKVTLLFIPEGTFSDVTLSERSTVLEGLAESSVYLPSSCGGGGTCGKCVFLSQKPLKTSSAEQEYLSKSQLEKGYRLGCQHKVSEVESIEIESTNKVENYQLIVMATNFITPFIKEVKFKVKSGTKLSYKAGAYMQFNIPAGMNALRPEDMPNNFEKYWDSHPSGKFSHEGAVRHYSLVNFDEESDELVFNVRWQTAENGHRAGVGSGYIASLQVGDVVLARGPFSDFYASLAVNKQRVFIGAGSGLAPLRAIIFEQLKQQSATNDMTLIYGARTEDDLLYREELAKLAQQHDNFSYIPTLSKPSLQWQGYQGYVQEVLQEQLSNGIDPLSAEFYLCGPKDMMTEVEQVLTGIGVTQEQIFKDKFTR